MDKWVRKTCYTYIMGYYSAIKKNKIWLFTEKWMKVEDIILSEIRQKKERQEPYVEAKKSI
jgi:F0F1-type ATP synthase epsilon subunit